LVTDIYFEPLSSVLLEHFSFPYRTNHFHYDICIFIGLEVIKIRIEISFSTMKVANHHNAKWIHDLSPAAVCLQSCTLSHHQHGVSQDKKVDITCCQKASTKCKKDITDSQRQKAGAENNIHGRSLDQILMASLDEGAGHRDEHCTSRVVAY
jgi:hypothetical protein